MTIESPAASTRRVSRVCERVRSKPTWTLTYPENRPCGYAVDMLRTTIKDCRGRGRGLMFAPLIVRFDGT
jgi:hypothetical protein